MCLGIPGEIVTIHQHTLRMGHVIFGSVRREICLEYVPEAQVGDYVVVHAGFAIAKLDLEQAERSAMLIESALASESAAPIESAARTESVRVGGEAIGHELVGQVDATGASTETT